MKVSPPPWLRPVRQAVRSALLHLQRSLTRLAQRVRETVVEAVAQAAAEVVRQASTPLLPVAEQFLDRASVHRPSGSSLIWDDDRQRPEYGYDSYEEPPEPDWEEYAPESVPETPPSTPSRLQSALATGCRVAAWLLDRGGSRPLTQALGAGVLTALAAFSGGPALAAGVGLLGTLATWLSLNAG